MGGGTFDISILEIGDGVFEVKATNGDTHLGGDDFDERILDWIADEFKKENGVDLRQDKQALQRIRDAAEKAKIELSSAAETEINQPYITQGSGGQPLHLTMKITRAKLEQLVDDLISKTIKPVEACLKDAKMKVGDINEVILVGGMTRMPKVYQTVKDYFGKEPNRSVNPDEVVALGASIQGGVLGGEVKDILLLDVTPLTLGVETYGGVMTPLIERNTTIPTSKSQIFSTAADNQTQVEINVLQGERPMAADNKSLGRFILDGLPPAPRGVPQVEVSFDLDANGILNVKAIDKATNKAQSIIIKGAVGLSEEEVEKARAEAEKYAEEDKKKKEKVEMRNQADPLVFTAEKTLKEAGDKVKAEDKAKVEAEIKNLKDLLEKEDLNKEQIDEATKKLSEALQAVGAAMYQQQQQQSGQTEQGQAEKPKEEEKKVEEGEVVE